MVHCGARIQVGIDSLSFMITLDYEAVDITIFLIWLTGDGGGTETNVNFQIKKL